ncbi:MAG: hypothetical protein H3C43_05600 [Leptonema sp. (in: Bacteria)]|nr:hypothetical protein [Leptonema sp. (in: bacteria)]
MNKRLYLDTTIWLSLAFDNERRSLVQQFLRQKLEDGWIFISSSFAVSELVAIEAESTKHWFDFLELIQDICTEILPLEFSNFDKAAKELLSPLQPTVSTSVHLALIKIGRCDAVASFSPTIRQLATVTGFDPLH